METENSTGTVTSKEIFPQSQTDVKSKESSDNYSDSPKSQSPQKGIQQDEFFLEQSESKTLKQDYDSAETMEIDENLSKCDENINGRLELHTVEMSPNKEISEELNDSGSSLARRARRKNKRKFASDFCCPVCGVTVRENELASHYGQEIEKLDKIPLNMMRLRQKKSTIKSSYIQVKANRESRSTAKLGEYAAKSSQEVQCPICRLRMTGSLENIDKHVASCVQYEEDEFVIVDGDETEDSDSFEEFVPYTYQPRETSSTAKRTCYNDEDEEVDVDDVDDKTNYGDPQYTELDVFVNTSDGDSVQLRQAVMGIPSAPPQVLESRKWGNIVDANESEMLSDQPGDSLSNQLQTDKFKNSAELDTSTKLENAETLDQTVTSLKEKIKDLEDENQNIKCLICMEPYTKPVVSTTCWHVHCEECWLMTMGVKKLCPQCNMIVFPSDLRKIYL